MQPTGTPVERRPPLCTIVIPTHRRPRLLAECLQAVAELDYPTDRLEAIVVDDGGGGVGSALRSVAARLEVSVVRYRGGGPAAARNEGAARASGEILAFTDDDCRPSATWLRDLVGAIGEAPRLAAGGYTVNALPGNRWSTASQRIIDLVYAYYNADPAEATFLTTNNLAVPAAAFDEVGGFDAGFRTAEDRDFCRRWLARGLELEYVPEARVLHAHPLTLGTFVRQHFDYGRGAFRFHARAGDAGDAQLRRAAGFYGSVPRLVRKAVNGDGASGVAELAADLVLWQAANGAGFAWEAARSVARKER
jgi:GT2 family glycosyltransferase